MTPDAIALSPPPPKGYYRLLDAFRGFAALWVVMLHACLATIYTTNPELGYNPLFAFSLWGQLGVTLFFVISGYCITATALNHINKEKAYSRFAIARFRRIYPPYFASLVLVVITTSLYAWLAAHHIIAPESHPAPVFGQSLGFYLAQLTLTQVLFGTGYFSSIYRTLCYEVAFYAVVLLCLFIARGSARRLAFLLCTVTLLSLLCLIVRHGKSLFPFNLWPQFGLGAMVYLILYYRGELWPKVVFALTSVLYLTRAILFEGKGYLGHPTVNSKILVAIVFSLLLLFLFRFDARLSRFKPIAWLCGLGTFSYSLFLTHFTMLAIVGKFGEKLHLTGNKFWISFLLQIASSIAFAYLFFLLFEKPFLNSKAQPSWHLSGFKATQTYPAETLAPEQPTS